MATVISPPKTEPPITARVIYPESDGKPMTETDFHAQVLIYLRTALEYYFRNEPNVYVSGNLMLYYEEGNPAASISPDVFVVKGINKKLRRTYKLWEEGKAPDVAIEITSRSTRLEDLGNKRALYAELGVTEYFIHDPYQEYLKPPLQGYRLEQNNYAPITPDTQAKLHSTILGLALQIIEGDLRLFDPRTGELLKTPLEAQEAAEEEAAARQAADAEVERLRAELKKLQQR
ncbi:MAG: Uma2 family endonuclease [Chloroflexi bacterium]|nr:Uma2 family endonuclease [Chloroflexota bacterium]